MTIGEDDTIALLRYNGTISIYCMPKWTWVLDADRWNAAWEQRGLDTDDHAGRFGIVVLDEATVGAFMSKASSFQLSPDVLREALTEELRKTRSWWELERFFPKLLIDFDMRTLTACYGLDGNPCWELWVPAGWTGEVEDFMRSSAEYQIPDRDCYWMREGKNILDDLTT